MVRGRGGAVNLVGAPDVVLGYCLSPTSVRASLTPAVETELSGTDTTSCTSITQPYPKYRLSNVLRRISQQRIHGMTAGSMSSIAAPERIGGNITAIGSL